MAETTAPDHDGPITFINSFVVAVDCDDEFRELYSETSAFFRGRSGFVSVRLHRALSPDATHRYVNIAVWRSMADFSAAHADDAFRALVSNPAWRDFPSSPALYEVIEHYAPE